MKGKYGRKFFLRMNRFKNESSCCCAETFSQKAQVINSTILLNLEPGKTAIIRDLPCDRHLRKRLLALGLLPGTRVTCLRKQRKTGLCIRLVHSEFCIDNSLAEHIHIGGVQ